MAKFQRPILSSAYLGTTEMKPAGFAAFLKLLELNDRLRKSELKRKLKGGGGFQYWRPLQTVAPRALAADSKIELLKAEIERLSSGAQRTYNQNGFASFCRWIKGKPLSPAATLPVIDAPFGNSGLTVRIKPDVSFEWGGQLFSMNLWATTKPSLSTPTLSMGLLFCSSAYRAEGIVSHKHLILDTIANRLFTEGDILPTAPFFLQNKIEAFKRDIDSLSAPPPASPEAPTDRPSIVR